jgi:hypothetical protein
MQDLESNVRALNNQVVESVFGTDAEDFNCWGFTAFMEGWINRLKWLDCETMDKLLAENSQPVDASELVPGDIAVYEDENDNVLTHTAVVTNPLEQELIHKPGGCALELQDFSGNLGHVTYGEITQFRRPNVGWNLGCA